MTGIVAGQMDAEATSIGIDLPDASPAVAEPLSQQASQATETRRLYATDWRAFVRWCRQQRQTPLPADPDTVAAYLARDADQSRPTVLGVLSRRAAAIADRHRHAGHASPTTDEAVRAVLRAARRATSGLRKLDTTASRPASRKPASSTPTAFPRTGKAPTPREAAQLAAVAARCAGDLAGLRDCALLLLVAAGIDGETLLSLDREHVHLDGQQLTLHPPSPRPGVVIPLVVQRGASAATCAVRALDSWLRVSDTRFGPVFRKVDRWGNVEHQRLRADGLRRIWQRRAAAVPRARARRAATS